MYPTRLPFLSFLFLPWLWVLWLLALPYCPIGFVTSLLGLPWPSYFIFTFYYSRVSASCHSYNTGPLGLLHLSLGFLGPFTLFLPLIPPIGLLAVIPTILAYNSLLPFIFLFPFTFLIVGLLCY